MELRRQTPEPVTPGSIVYDKTAGDHFVHNGTEWQPLHGRDMAHSLQTYSGRFFWPLQPRADEIRVEDIAMGLAREFRYGNQSPFPYPVAWHCVALSFVVPAPLQPFALVHDAPEAYIKDMPRTIRRQEPFKTEYDRIDNQLLDVCCEFFGIENKMEELKPYDVQMSWSEMVVWAEDSLVFQAKMNAMDVDQESARDPLYIDWVRNCPREEEGDFINEARVAWLMRYHMLFDGHSEATS